MTQSKKDRKKEAGFTLIEIIAVLVILGVLAAVAVPRYYDMQTQARLRAVESGGAEMQARINQIFAQRLMAGTACATAAVVAAADIDDADATIGGWNVTSGTWPTAADTSAAIVITSAVDTTITGSVTIRLPACN